MFNNLFRSNRKPPSDAQERLRAVSGSSTAELAASLLIAPSSLMQLTPKEALVVVSYMVPRKILAGTTFMREGDESDNDYMMLVLEGEVTVETAGTGQHESDTVTVLGAGSLVGEIGLIDGQPRLASCTASTDVLCAILSRSALEELSRQAPATAAKLMFAVSVRLAERLRATTEKLKKFSLLMRAMQDQILPE